ncbi:MAG: hypothetical protein ACXVXP_06810 [Mycobacteriaceae bacterium]
MTAAREPIFDEADRTDTKPAEHSESTFEFLNRVGGDYWQHPRLLMQTWLDRVSGHRNYNDLRQRFRSRDDEQFRSAFLELYLHEGLLRAGYVVTIHPSLPGSPRRPDFRAERDGRVLFIEAVAPGSGAAAKAAAKRRAVLFDTVNQLGDPNFMLWLEHLEESSAPPASARLRADLRGWLAQLDPDGIPDLDRAPTRTWQHNGWSATFRAIPKKPEARGTRPHERAIGVFGHGEAGLIDDAPAIRKALAAKHHSYGDLGAPFIIAIGTYIFDTDRWHSTNAMYGRLGVQLEESPSGELLTREVRSPDGYFGTPPNWRNSNVSGVLLVNQLMPYYVQRAEATLWRHPLAAHPLPEDLGLPVESMVLQGGGLNSIRLPVKADAFFGLPDPWPPGEPWSNG